jgi:hypothetical protein
MSLRKERIIVLGFMGQSPFAGVAYQFLHYLEGFRRLGHEVYYIEDTGAWPYDHEKQEISADPSYTLGYINQTLRHFGFGERWGYKSAVDGTLSGLSDAAFRDLLGSAAALVNVTGSTWLGAEYLQVPIRILVETDPVLFQIQLAKGELHRVPNRDAHTHHFTFGENFGAPDCGVPIGRYEYIPTRQPVVCDWWAPEDSARHEPSTPLRLTTVANWDQSGQKDIEWNGEKYNWTKSLEFLKFIDLPAQVSCQLELALASASTEVVAQLKSAGWFIAPGVALSRNATSYMDYVKGSHGEFTVAKDQYYKLRSGWFSDRSASYLAAGLPVITQDTGFGNVLPTGEALFPFLTVEDVVDAVDQINVDYERQSRLACEIAREYFEAEVVIKTLLQATGIR